MNQKPSKNYLLLGASLLIVGLLIQFLKDKIINYPMNIVYKTLLIMFMIAVGYSFAGSIMHPFAAKSLKILQFPFIKLAGPGIGRVLFYIVIYGALFTAYLFVFIYGIKP
ncbi:hypothetical protein KY363_06395 [Candidatus Woesearchaeota archaeon]|nr:hypothetical protein [Candidatus Woesearchaeota archaeon]